VNLSSKPFKIDFKSNSNEFFKSFSLVIKTNHHKGKYAAACMHKHVFNLIINFNFSKIIISLSFHAHINTQLNQILLFKIFQKLGCYSHRYQGNHGRNQLNKERFGKLKFNMPKFDGGSDPETYLTWELKVDKIFHVHNYSE
jgi:hypothetical protein